MGNNMQITAKDNPSKGSEHGQLTGREAPKQHPLSAIFITETGDNADVAFSLMRVTLSELQMRVVEMNDKILTLTAEVEALKNS